MPISSEEKVQLLSNVLQEMALIGYRLDRLLVGFQLYHEYKGSLDIREYESALEVFETGIKAMEEQMRQYHRLFTYLQSLVE